MSKTPPSPSEPAALATVDARSPRTVAPRTVTALTAPPVDPVGMTDLPDHLQELLREYLSSARSANTRKAYADDWKHWRVWALANGQRPFPTSPVVAAAYAASLAKEGKKYSTIVRRLTTLNGLHKLARQPEITDGPEVRMTLAGIARQRGKKPEQKEPITREELERLLAVIPREGLGGLRDHAIVLLGFAGAFRSSELVALDVEDITWSTEPRGVIVLLRHSKTDQEGEGFEKYIVANDADPDFCAVTALRRWLDAAQIKTGPIFRALNKHGSLRSGRFSPESITYVVKKYVTAAGLDATKFASHSLRSGHVTQGLFDGVDYGRLKAMTGHASIDMLLRYDRRKKRNPFAATSSNLLSGKKDQTK